MALCPLSPSLRQSACQLPGLRLRRPGPGSRPRYHRPGLRFSGRRQKPDPGRSGGLVPRNISSGGFRCFRCRRPNGGWSSFCCFCPWPHSSSASIATSSVCPVLGRSPRHSSAWRFARSTPGPALSSLSPFCWSVGACVAFWTTTTFASAANRVHAQLDRGDADRTDCGSQLPRYCGHALCLAVSHDYSHGHDRAFLDARNRGRNLVVLQDPRLHAG